MLLNLKIFLPTYCKGFTAEYGMGFIRIGVKVITSFCKCPNIRTTLQYNVVQRLIVGKNLFTTIVKILSKHSASHETTLCFRKSGNKQKRCFFYFALSYFMGKC